MMMILFVSFGTNQHFITEFVIKRVSFTLFNEIVNKSSGSSVAYRATYFGIIWMSCQYGMLG